MKKTKHIRRTDEEIREIIALYESNYTLSEVGAFVDLCRERVRQILVQAGHPTRKYTDSKIRIAKNEKAYPEEVLRKLYWEENKTLAEIAEMFNCSFTVIYRRFIEYNIPRRPDAIRSSFVYEKYPELTKNTLQTLFIEENKTTQEIADLYGCPRITVYKRLERFGIKKKRKS